jgi:nodulation protein E
MGVFCSSGRTVPEFWRALLAGDSGIRPITQVECSGLRFTRGAEVAPYRAEQFFSDSAGAGLDRFAQFGAIAAREAIADSGIAGDARLANNAAIVTAACLGGHVTLDSGYRALYAEQKDRLHPLTIPRIMANSAASRIATEFDMHGPCFTVSTACSGGTHAIGLAFWLVRSGAVEVAVAGGSEAPFAYGFLKAWEALRVIASDTCRPFSIERKGTILGEGAGMVVIEALDSATRRGARIHAELSGFGMTADAFHLTAPDGVGARTAMEAAMRDGHVALDRVGYINAHGTGTELNDIVEAQAIKDCFGGDAKRVLVSSTKGAHGHCLGATGAIEAIATTLALEHQTIPPTINFRGEDPRCDLNLVVERPREDAFNVALSNSFAFGGLNAVLALSRADRP